MSGDILCDYPGDSYTRHFEPSPDGSTMVINMGPQHPSTHGVLRIVCELDGEYIRRAEPVLGYVHRMHEKMGQTRSFAQYWPNMGRVDYLHALAWNQAYALAAEKLGGIEVPDRAEYLRTISVELNRISSHLLWWGAYLLDLGAFTPILYAFADREIIMDILQVPTGSRLTYCYFRFGGVYADMGPATIESLKDYVGYQRSRFPMYRDLVTDNIILRQRCENIGVFTPELIRRYGATGPVARGSGLNTDTRVQEPYSIYDRFKFKVPVHHEGDAMARYMVRMDEMEQSLRILEQALEQLGSAKGAYINPKAPKPTWKAPAGESYAAVEGARGRIGLHLVSDGGKNPYRIKLRSPSYCNLSLFAEAAKGVLLGDAVSILGSLDLVIPEIDR
jgi:NADH-quinone oxidoreductase subunit D